MKLAEALAERADAQRRVAQLVKRIQLSARMQESEAPRDMGIDDRASLTTAC